MLGGIKKGKRKRKHSSNSSSSGSGNKSTYDTSCASVTATTSAVSGHSSSLTSTTVKSIRTEPATTTPYTVTGTVNSSNISNLSRGPSVALISSTKNEANLNAAHELRLMLAGVKKKAATETNDDSTTVVAEQHGINKNSSAYERFERRRGDGTILNSIDEHKNGNDGDTDAIIVMNSKVAPNLSKEDFRRGARKGKLKSAISSSSSFTNPEDHTIEQMLQEERQSRKGQGQHHQQHGGSNHQSIDEIFARNIARMGSKYKGTEFKMTAGSTAGADEDEINNGIDMNLYTSISNRLTDAERYKRDLSKQIDYTKKQSSVANKCWWWIESQSFAKQRLLALGDFMSLVLVPTHLQLVPYQCYLVPIQHSESFVSCEDEVWEEVQRFKTSLRNMFRQEDKGVLFCETVLSTKSLWQTRMDVIPVPLSVEQDAELFFKSALNEQAEEWGTHNKLLSTKGKTLRQTIPKGFSYFNIEWNDGGFAQIIETNSFPKDFSLDTIAGMMELDPVRFGRKRKASDYDRGAAMDFVQKWRSFDWTLALDSCTDPTK